MYAIESSGVYWEDKTIFGELGTKSCVTKPMLFSWVSALGRSNILKNIYNKMNCSLYLALLCVGYALAGPIQSPIVPANYMRNTQENRKFPLVVFSAIPFLWSKFRFSLHTELVRGRGQNRTKTIAFITMKWNIVLSTFSWYYCIRWL